MTEREIAFLCDGFGCDSLSCKNGGPCRHTRNIDHAKNFEKLADGKYIERGHLDGWIQVEDTDYGGDGYNMCPACKWKFSFLAYPLIYEHSFCPNCGMRVKGDDDWDD